jgi:hypothetical protein
MRRRLALLSLLVAACRSSTPTVGGAGDALAREHAGAYPETRTRITKGPSPR